MNARADMAACCHESPPSPASTPGLPSDKRPHERPATLRLLAEPRRRFLTNVPRVWTRVPEPLRAVLADALRGRARWPIFAHGGVGTGKTCAGLLLCDHAAPSTIYTDFAELVGRWIDAGMGRLRERGTHAECAVTQGMLRDDWAAANLIVLDELGTRERLSDAAYEALRRLLDARLGRPLVVLSNLDLDGIARVVDDRVASRLAGGTVVPVDGPDQRLAWM